MTIRAVIFDFGNVINRWEPEKAFADIHPDPEVIADAFERFRLTDWVGRVMDAGADIEGSLQEILATDPERARFLRHYTDNVSAAHQTAIPGTIDIIDALLDCQEIQVFGMTNAGLSAFEALEERFDVIGRMADVFVSARERLMKPDPCAFVRFLSRHDLQPSECIFIDDNAHNVAAAAELGFTAIQFENAEKLKADLETHGLLRESGTPDIAAYNFAYLDEQTKRMIRRAILKAIAIPGYQVPFASREMPMPYGWGTGGVQVTASIIGPDDILKVIDQGSDDTTNAVSIRAFFARVARVVTTTKTADATIIQTRHRIPEEPLKAGQVLVYQVPIPEPLRFLEPRETETRVMHALEEYGLMHVKLYEDIATHGRIATSYAYPVKVERRYVMDPSPTPKFDNPKMHMSEALQLFGAGREKRIYALPPFTDVRSLDFDDHPFEVNSFDKPCALCGAEGVYLDEVILDDCGGRMFCCSDTDHCETRRESGHRGEAA